MRNESPTGKIIRKIEQFFFKGLKFIKDTGYLVSLFKKDSKKVKQKRRRVKRQYDKEYLKETSKLRQKATNYITLSNEMVCLGVMRIAGTTHLDDKTVLGKLDLGDSLILKREDNPYDQNAILVLNADHQKVGYIPKEKNILLAGLMDDGENLIAQIIQFNVLGDFVEIVIAVYVKN